MPRPLEPRQLTLFPDGPVEITRSGIRLTESDLWLDAGSPQRLSFVSHGHSDHISRHEKALLTPPTRRFFDARMPGHSTKLVEIDYGMPYPVGRSMVTLFPAGHILGSAQVLVENTRRVVYTGDLRLRASQAAEPAEIKQCDILIMEATFGSPQYRFPTEAETEQMLKTEIDTALSQGRVPIVRAYALGKAQEVIQTLNRCGYHVLTEPVVKQYCDVYESFGVKLGPLEVFGDPAHLPYESEGRVIVVGSTATFRKVTDVIPLRRTIFVSGWGIDPRARYRYGVDVVIPLSDHADFYDLIEYVRLAQPREVLVTHGAPEFADHLRQLGFDARYLKNR